MANNSNVIAPAEIFAEPGQVIQLGAYQSNNQYTIKFNLRGWKQYIDNDAEPSNPTIALYYLLAGQVIEEIVAVTPADVIANDYYLDWPVTSTVTSVPGAGTCQIRYTPSVGVNTELYSYYYQTIVTKSVSTLDNNTLRAAYANWIDQLTTLIAEATNINATATTAQSGAGASVDVTYDTSAPVPTVTFNFSLPQGPQGEGVTSMNIDSNGVITVTYYNPATGQTRTQTITGDNILTIMAGYRDAAQTAATNAQTAQTAAESARDLARKWANNNDGSSTPSATNNAKYFATQASTSATNASTSATQASTSATNASTSATNASTSATNAATAQSNAEAARDLARKWANNNEGSTTPSATNNAKYFADQASSSAQSAYSRASSAAQSATSAQTYAGTATEQAVLAQSAANDASTSAQSASTSASNAATSATNASNSASAASNSASSASTSATNASTSATNAEAAWNKLNTATATASALAPGSAPTVSITDVSGHKNFGFGIPRGDTGATGATGTRGNEWYSGTAITGTSTTPTVFPSSGITDAIVNDLYLNTNDGNTYQCTLGGAASVAKWKYIANIRGPQGPAGSGTLDTNTDTTLTGILTGNGSKLNSIPLSNTSVGSASNWSAGSVPTLGTAIDADDITAWTTNTPSTFTVDSTGKLVITAGAAATLTYTARSIPNVTSVGTAPSLTVTATSVLAASNS